MGEILLQSPALTPGYLNNEEANRMAFTSDGWLCTDDVGYIDPDGRVFVEGRQSDSILRGAYILYPGWLEKEIKKSPHVKDVVVVPVPDPVLHNEICACIMIDDILNQQSMGSTGNGGSVFISDISLSKSDFSFKSEGNALIGGPSNVDSRNQASVESCPIAVTKLEQIRITGMKKNVNIDYKVTKAKNEEGISKSVDNNRTYLERLEMNLRQLCDDCQFLAEKDAMRMVPKYYVFCENFPLTATGKINRKEVRKMASDLLGLQ